MGACFQTVSFKTSDGNDAVERCHEYINRCKYDYGHAGYTGTFAECTGAIMTDKVFGSTSDAMDWLDENTNKWGPAVGVTIKLLDKEPYIMFGAICSE